MLMKRLIFFDIDGTLTRTQNGYIPFNEAVVKTFGVNGDIRSVIPDGNTDPRIVEDIFAQARVKLAIDEEKWSEFSVNLRACYSSAVKQGSTAIRALPGAAALLRQLSEEDEFICSVVTGNLESMATVKLETAGLSSYLCRGAYGSDSPRRPDLPLIAKRRCEQLSGRFIALDRCIVVGDTPKDLEAARQNHMKCILVGTGRYPMEELMLSKPDHCRPDLCDTAEVMRALASL
jgi:phosphoglycolate phosphatase-like HAD superfamily hydrolase